MIFIKLFKCCWSDAIRRYMAGVGQLLYRDPKTTWIYTFHVTNTHDYVQAKPIELTDWVALFFYCYLRIWANRARRCFHSPAIYKPLRRLESSVSDSIHYGSTDFYLCACAFICVVRQTRLNPVQSTSTPSFMLKLLMNSRLRESINCALHATISYSSDSAIATAMLRLIYVIWIIQ